MNDGTTIWSWRPEVGPRLQRNVWAAGLAVVVAIGVSAGIAVATPSRFVIVLTVMLAGIGVFWWREHRRYRATEVVLDGAGTLRVGDGRQAGSIDLRSVDSVAVRLRTQPGISILSSHQRWTLELAGPDATLTHPIAHAAGLFNPDASDIERLEAELAAHVERWSGRPVSTKGVAAGADAQVRVADRAATAGTTTGPDDVEARAQLAAPIGRFEWRPPRSPNADRRRRWFRIGYVGAAVLVSVLGIVSAWGDWVGVVLSAVTVPGIVLLCFGGLDWGLGRARRFRLYVDGDVLHVESASGSKQIGLPGATVRLDRHAQFVATATTHTRSTNWILTVGAADGSTLTQLLPSWGTITREEDYVALERELRRRT